MVEGKRKGEGGGGYRVKWGIEIEIDGRDIE